MSESTERAAFEAWYEADALMEHSNWFRRDEDGDYLLDTVQGAWRVWRARASLLEGKAEPAHPGLKETPYGPAILLDDLRDAERYRWLRDGGNVVKFVSGAAWSTPQEFDAAIDAAMSPPLVGENE